MAGIGHNSGRVDEPGKSWRTHVWAKARRQLMPTLPIEVVRRRVARAKELGLPYKTYAGLRASSGDDLIGFMFSNNALDVLRRTDKVPAVKAAKITALKDARTIGLAQLPTTPDQLTPPLQTTHRAPMPLAPWVEKREHLREVFAHIGRPSSRFILICDTAMEREWVEAGRMAGALPAQTFFEVTQ